MILEPTFDRAFAGKGRSALQEWSAAWRDLLREHEKATGEGIRIHLETNVSLREDDPALPARERWKSWQSIDQASRSRRCVAVAHWRSSEAIFRTLPEWSWFCGLSLEAALPESGQSSPFSAAADQIRNRLLENASSNGETEATHPLADLPSTLLETTDLLSAHLLVLLTQLQTPLALDSSALADRLSTTGSDFSRIPLWQDISGALLDDRSSSSMIGGDEDPSLDLPTSRWVIAFTLVTGLPLLLGLAAWIYSRESRWTRFGRRKISALQWARNWMEAARSGKRWAKGSTAESTRVLRGTW